MTSSWINQQTQSMPRMLGRSHCKLSPRPMHFLHFLAVPKLILP